MYTAISDLMMNILTGLAVSYRRAMAMTIISTSAYSKIYGTAGAIMRMTTAAT